MASGIFLVPVRLQDGAAGTPSLTFSLDTDTGFYRSADNQVDLVVGGASIIRTLAGGLRVLVGSVGVGTASPDASALLDLTSTTKGLLRPRMTTTQKNAIVSPATGLEVFDTTLNRPEFYNGTAWASMAGGGAGGHTIQNEGAGLTSRTNLNAVGFGIETVDDAGNDATLLRTVEPLVDDVTGDVITDDLTGEIVYDG